MFACGKKMTQNHKKTGQFKSFCPYKNTSQKGGVRSHYSLTKAADCSPAWRPKIMMSATALPPIRLAP